MPDDRHRNPYQRRDDPPPRQTTRRERDSDEPVDALDQLRDVLDERDDEDED